MKTNQFDIHEQITDRILKAIEAGAAECRLPWHASTPQQLPRNVASDKSYRGINILALWAAQLDRGYQSPYWGTYHQWQCLGAQVRRGEKSSLIVFYRETVRTERNEAGEPEEKRGLVARASLVFNADQVEGYPLADGAERIDRTEQLAAADELIAATGAAIESGASLACYWPDEDVILMPARDRFTGTATSTATESYYSVLFHELTHWTAAEQRLNRNLKNRFGSEAYAMEELIAELGAAFLCARVGMASEPRADHAAYMATWVNVLKSDKKAIFTAASKASQAVDYLTGDSPAGSPSTETNEQGIERAGGAAENLSNLAA